jgi:uncharacterized repeat protein (TIGR03803 family)
VDGLLYGTTLNGSVNYCSQNCQNNDCYLGCGTVFAVTETGDESVVYNFKGNFHNAGDGTWPFAGLIWLNGAFYGTTSGGGGTGNYGTVFTITATGQEQVLYAFKGGQDGQAPEAPLILAGGRLYGTTVYGGGTGCGGSGCGTVFAVNASGTEQVVYRFASGNDGANAYSGLTVMRGKLYGTTLFGGGSGCGGRGCGTIYDVDPTTNEERVLHRFGTGIDGSFPNGLTPLDGTLYGTTEGGGTRSSGSFFSITPAGHERVLYNFLDIPDGNLPGANLIAADGIFYGTTVGGGTTGVGTVFSVTPSGSESVLYSFQGGTDGSDPQAPLVAIKRELYGTTDQGGGSGCGGNGCGTIFKVKR